MTLDIVAENPYTFRVVALAAGSNVTLLANQVKKSQPEFVAVRNEFLLGQLREDLADANYKPKIFPREGVIELLMSQLEGLANCGIHPLKLVEVPGGNCSNLPQSKNVDGHGQLRLQWVN